MPAGLRDTRGVSRFALVLFAAVACGPSAKPDPIRPTAPAAADDPSCPLLVAGTSVAVEDTDTGAALVFVTTGDAAAVRKRAATLVDMHNAHHAGMTANGSDDMAGMPGMNMGGSGDPGHVEQPDDAAHRGGTSHGASAMGEMIQAHSTAAAIEVPHGARVTFRAETPAGIAELQAELRMHARHLASGSCEMSM
jgi:hypothetical protein